MPAMDYMLSAALCVWMRLQIEQFEIKGNCIGSDYKTRIA